MQFVPDMVGSVYRGFNWAVACSRSVLGMTSNSLHLLFIALAYTCTGVTALMEAADVQALVDGKVQDAMQANNAELLRSIGDMISKISQPSPSPALSPLDAPKFKRKSNEEQFKQNAKVLSKLEEVESNINSQNIQDAKQSLIEGIIRHFLRSLCFLFVS